MYSFFSYFTKHRLPAALVPAAPVAAEGATIPAAKVPNKSPDCSSPQVRRAVPRRGIAGCWPADAVFQQGSAVRFLVLGREVVGNVRKCDNSASVVKYQ